MATHSITATFGPRAGDVDGAPGQVAPPAERIGTMARVGRWVTLLVAATAMVFVLAGSVAEPAAARPASMGTVADRCNDMGGDPTVYGVFGMNFTYCDWGDGTGVWGMD